jgi:hypothetical protein
MIRVTFGPEPPPRELPSLFSPGMAWQRAAHEWAISHGLTVERIAIDQRFLTDGAWHLIAWNDATEQWDVRREAPDPDDLGDACGQWFPEEPPAAPPDYPPTVLHAHRRRLTA